MRISDWSSDVCSSDLFADSPEFDPLKQSAAAQVRQFGYNNDFIGYVGLPFGSDNADHGLLCVNHEYTSEEVMFPDAGTGVSEERVAIELAAHGGPIVAVRRETGRGAGVRGGRRSEGGRAGKGGGVACGAVCGRIS